MKTTHAVLALSLLFLLNINSIAADIRDGLVSYWPLDVVNAGTTPDLALGNDLELFNMSEANLVPGRRGNAMSFDGSEQSNHYLAYTNNANGLPIYNSGAYTVMLWVKGIGAAQGDRRVFSEGYSLGNRNPLFNIGTDSAAAASRTGVVDIYIRTDAGTAVVNHRKSAVEAFDGEWRHIAWVEENGVARLYIDGQLDATNFDYTRGPLTLDTVSIGAVVRDNVCCWFGGLIDEVAVWERPLSQEEIQQVMNDGIETPIPETPPVILTQSTGATRNLGDRVTFSVRAGGPRPFSYEWFKGDELLAGETGSALTLHGLEVGDSGSYRVEISNFEGTTSSQPMLLTVQPDPVPDVPAGLVSFWPFDEISDGSTPDIYNRNDMALVLMDETNLVPGRFENALSFDGFEEYAHRTTGFPIYNNPVYSVSLWVRGTPQSDLRVFSEGSDQNNTPLFTLGTHPSGSDASLLVFIRNDAGTVLLARQSTRAVFDGQWRHVVWVDNNGQGRLYVDGVLDETDFNYVRGALTLNQTSVGAVLRGNPSNHFAGQIDEVAVWNRALSLTEIDAVMFEGIPAPVAPIPPSITLQPAGRTLLSRSSATLTAEAVGTSPLFFQWYKDGEPVSGATNNSLFLPNLQISDSAVYTLMVTNSAGSTSSDPAELVVIARPEPPAQLRIDINNTGNEGAAETEPGFESFAITGPGPGATTRSFGGVDVTLSGVGVNIESRLRLTPNNSGEFTQSRLLRDFVFARDSATDEGMQLLVEFLRPNQAYRVNLWAFDTGSTGNPRISDWYANGVQAWTGYSFSGSAMPSSNEQYQMEFNATTDAEGRLQLLGMRNAAAAGNLNVFLNAFQLTVLEAIPPLRILGIEQMPGNRIRLTLQSQTPQNSLVIETAFELNDPIWESLPEEVTFSSGAEGVLHAEFNALPYTSFFRAVHPPAP
jgi:hypothetical protein